MESAAFALKVWSKRTAQIRALSPSQPKPFQVFDDCIPEFFPAPLRVEILDTQNQFAVCRPGPFLRTPKSHGMSDVQITGGRWRDSAAVSLRGTWRKHRLSTATQRPWL